MNVDAVSSTLDPNVQHDGGHDVIVEKRPTQDNPGATLGTALLRWMGQAASATLPRLLNPTAT